MLVFFCEFRACVHFVRAMQSHGDAPKRKRMRAVLPESKRLSPTLTLIRNAEPSAIQLSVAGVIVAERRPQFRKNEGRELACISSTGVHFPRESLPGFADHRCFITVLSKSYLDSSVSTNDCALMGTSIESLVDQTNAYRAIRVSSESLAQLPFNF